MIYVQYHGYPSLHGQETQLTEPGRCPKWAQMGPNYHFSDFGSHCQPTKGATQQSREVFLCVAEKVSSPLDQSLVAAKKAKCRVLTAHNLYCFWHPTLIIHMTEVQNCHDQGVVPRIGLNSNPAVSDKRASFSMSRTCILFNLGPERALLTAL